MKQTITIGDYPDEVRDLFENANTWQPNWNRFVVPWIDRLCKKKAEELRNAPELRFKVIQGEARMLEEFKKIFWGGDY